MDIHRKHKWSNDFHISNEVREAAVNDQFRGAAPLNLPPPPNWQDTDSIMIKAPGYWEFHSYTDNRWNTTGTSKEVGGTEMCLEAKSKLEDLFKKLGKPPFDLIYRFEPKDLKKFKVKIDAKMKKRID